MKQPTKADFDVEVDDGGVLADGGLSRFFMGSNFS
jgi:hypothetical protein